MNQEKTAPVVFISYSHDSEEHKRWVLEFAQELVKQHGIEVDFDAWNKLGTDIVRSMKEGISRCDFVLMICTENYVKRADEGKGGVGYETMIFDSELIQDVGINKFIPIIRQRNRGIRLPKSVGTRLAVDFSEGKNREEGMQKLLETLHSLPPATKPLMGGGPLPAGAPTAHILPLSQYPSDPSGLYDAALRLAQTGDLPAWRRLVEKKKTEFVETMTQRTQRRNVLPARSPVDGLEVLEPLFAVALAGVESGLDRFNRQEGLVFDLLAPPFLEQSGPPAAFPEVVAFVFQALLGTFAVYSGQPRLVFDLANQRVRSKYRNKSNLLWKNNELIGWPNYLNHDCKVAWRFLWELPKEMPWVAEKISGERRFRECLCGHYFLLSFVEFIDCMRGRSQFPDRGLHEIAVPPLFIAQDELSAGLRDVLEEKQQLLEYIHSKGVSQSALVEAWPKWVKRSENFMMSGGSSYYPEDTRDEYKHFMEDLLS